MRAAPAASSPGGGTAGDGQPGSAAPLQATAAAAPAAPGAAAAAAAAPAVGAAPGAKKETHETKDEMDASGSPPGGGQEAEKTSPAAVSRKKPRTRRLTGRSVPTFSSDDGTDSDGTDSDGTDSDDESDHEVATQAAASLAATAIAESCEDCEICVARFGLRVESRNRWCVGCAAGHSDEATCIEKSTGRQFVMPDSRI